MIITSTSSIPNREIIEIISIVNTSVVESDMSLLSNNKDKENFFDQLIKKGIERLKINAQKLKADALIEVKIDIEPFAGGSIFIINLIATAVKLNKKVASNEGVSIEIINENINKHKILQSIETETFNPHINWAESFILKNPFPEIFDSYMNWIISPNFKPENWQDLFSAYISNLNPTDLFDKTVQYFSKETRTDNEQTSLRIIFQHLVIDYKKVLDILTEDPDIEHKRSCLNILYHYNKIYTNTDFDLVSKLLVKIKEVFPVKATEEIGTGLMSKGNVYWRCSCGTKNTTGTTRYCSKCSLDEYGNKAQTRHLRDVIARLEELLLAYK